MTEAMKDGTATSSFHRVGRILAKLRAVVRILAEAREGKQVLQELVRRESARLRPGIWLIGDPRGARHWLHGRVPGFLRESKLRHEGGWGWAGFLGRVARRVAPPIFVRVPRGGGSYALLLPAKGAAAVLLDPKGGRVLRPGLDPEALNTAIAVRSQMAEHLKSPPFEVAEGGTVLSEVLIAGRSIAGMASLERRDVWRRVAAGYAELHAVAAEGSAGPIVRSAVEAVAACQPPEDLGRLLEREGGALVRWAGERAAGPAHGDLGPSNIIVSEDGTPWLIDFEARRVGVLPFFHDPLFLAVREAKRGRPDLLHRITSGEETAVLNMLWRATGAEPSSAELGRSLLAVLVVHVYRRGLDGGSLDPDRTRRAAAETWTPLAPVLLQ